MWAEGTHVMWTGEAPDGERLCYGGHGLITGEADYYADDTLLWEIDAGHGVKIWIGEGELKPFDRDVYAGSVDVRS